jgi:hypothetical protein
MTPITLNSTIIKSPDQISTDLGGEVVILDMQSEEYFSFDGVGARIWEMIETPTTVREILAAILQAYDVEPARAESDLLAVLDEMAQEGLIEVQ